MTKELIRFWFLFLFFFALFFVFLLLKNVVKSVTNLNFPRNGKIPIGVIINNNSNQIITKKKFYNFIRGLPSFLFFFYVLCFITYCYVCHKELRMKETWEEEGGRRNIAPFSPVMTSSIAVVVVNNFSLFVRGFKVDIYLFIYKWFI